MQEGKLGIEYSRVPPWNQLDASMAACSPTTPPQDLTDLLTLEAATFDGDG